MHQNDLVDGTRKDSQAMGPTRIRPPLFFPAPAPSKKEATSSARFGLGPAEPPSSYGEDSSIKKVAPSSEATQSILELPGDRASNHCPSL